MEQFVFEALVTYVESLALAHADDRSLGMSHWCFLPAHSLGEPVCWGLVIPP